MQKKNGKPSKETIEMERDLLKITLNHYVRENEELKQNLEDMKITVMTNKHLLKDYVDNITGKDKVVEKLRNQVEQLESRLLAYEEFTKNLQSASPLKSYKRRDLTERSGVHSHLNLAADNNNDNTSELTSSREVMSMRRLDLKVKNIPLPSINRIKEDKFKQYCAKQLIILQELANMQNELKTISAIGRKNYDSCGFKEEIEVDPEEKAQVNTKTRTKTINIKDHFNEENVVKFRDILSSSNGQNIIFLIDGANNVWELVKRPDLNEVALLNNPQSVEPIVYSRQQEIALMEIKDNQSKSLSNSDLDVSKGSEFNISNLIKDSENEMGDSLRT